MHGSERIAYGCMYHGLGEFVDGFTKNAHAGFGRSAIRPVVFVLLGLWMGVVPFLWPVAHLAGPSSTSNMLGASLALLLVSRALVHLRLGFPLWTILFSPISTVITMFIILRSLRMTHGDGVVRWRGREYPHASTEF